MTKIKKLNKIINIFRQRIKNSEEKMEMIEKIKEIENENEDFKKIIKVKDNYDLEYDKGK